MFRPSLQRAKLEALEYGFDRQVPNPLWGIGAAFLAAPLSIIAVALFYRWSWFLDERGLQRARDKYRGIYRVVAMPTDPRVIAMPGGAEIKIGDYGCRRAGRSLSLRCFGHVTSVVRASYEWT